MGSGWNGDGRLMQSKDFLQKGTIVCGIILVIGAMMFLLNMKNLEDCILFGDLVSDMRRAHVIAGLSWSETAETAYANAVKSGNIAFTGIVISVVAVIVWIIVYFSYLKKVNIEAIKEQSSLIKSADKSNTFGEVSKVGNKDKIEELVRMKESGFITDEEYEEMIAKL